MDDRLATRPASTSEYLFVFYEELADFRIRKSRGPHMGLLSKALQVEIEASLSRFIEIIAGVSKSCSERYSGVETIGLGVFLLICTILCILVLNKNLLQNNLILYLLILGPTVLSTVITIIICQVSKNSRLKRKIAVSQKLGLLIDDLNKSLSKNIVRVELGPDSFVGSSMDFSLVFSVTLDVTNTAASPMSLLSKLRDPVPPIKESQPTGTSSTAVVVRGHNEPALSGAEAEHPGHSSPMEKAESRKPARLKGRVMTISPTTRRVPKISPIIHTGQVQPRSVSYVKAL